MYEHPRTSDEDRLQDGIYFRHGEWPRRAYRVLLLDVADGTPRAQARAAIENVWKRLGELRKGAVRELQPPDAKIPVEVVEHGNLTCLLGFGERLFGRGRNPNLTPNTRKPARLLRLDQSAYQPFPRLRWADEKRRGEADLAIQFIADTELAVNRAVVEVYRLIEKEAVPLRFVTFFGGFNRDDKRSWLGFHDGVGNIRTDERAAAMEVVDKNEWDPEWMVGGTYMAFLRLDVNLKAWWKLSREEQELRVGRDKLNGCPIISIREEPGNGGARVRYVPVPDDNCPQRPDHQNTAGHKDPGLPNHTLLVKSHMYRANPTRLGPGSHGSNRIFRQGYEFLEPLADGTPRVGLNFVSFQCDLERFTNILMTGGWMSSINFGGPDDREEDIPSIELAQVVAGGYYAVPPLPLGDDPFPGAVIFR